jgi:type 1 fimbriae regulatory protein FimE
MTINTLKAKKSRASFSAKLAKHKNLPPAKTKNLEVRSREYLTSAEVIDLRDTARQIGRYGFRDWLLLMVMYRHALRVGEIIDLRWDQIDLKAGKLHVNRIKNGDPSVHYLEGDEVRSLRKLHRDQPTSAFVFCSERGGPLTTRAVHNIVARAGREAGFEFPVHPHMLRHAKGYQLASKGIDTRAIQAYLGHRNIQHTVIYTKLDPRRFKGFGKD